MTAHGADEDHHWLVAGRILDGSVVSFPGAGANPCGRPESWAIQCEQPNPKLDRRLWADRGDVDGGVAV